MKTQLLFPLAAGILFTAGIAASLSIASRPATLAVEAAAPAPIDLGTVTVYANSGINEYRPAAQAALADLGTLVVRPGSNVFVPATAAAETVADAAPRVIEPVIGVALLR